LEKGVGGLFVRHANSIDPTPRPGYKEALYTRLFEAWQVRRMSRFSFSALFGGAPGRRFATIGFTALILVVVATIVLQPFFGVKTVYAFDNFTLTAEQSDTLGIANNSSFLLESKQKINASAIKNDLSVNTDVSYKMNQLSDKKVRIAFEKPLDAAQVVSFKLQTQATDSSGQIISRPYSWAFQVKSPFRVLGTLPGTHQSQTPLDAAIEVNFSHENIDPKAFERALTITPALSGHIESSRRTFVFVPEKLTPQTIYTVTIDGSLGLTGSDETLGQSYTFQFETAPADEMRSSEFSLQDHFYSVSPSSTVAIPYYVYGEVDGAAVHIKVHRFVPTDKQPSAYDQYAEAVQKADDLMWTSYGSVNQIVDLSTMPITAEFDVTGMEFQWQKYLVFPSSLENGYYLAEFEVGGKQSWALIESSPLTAYIAKATNETLVWVNSADTHKPVKSANVRFVGDETFSPTDQNGLSSLSAENRNTQAYLDASHIEIKSGTDAIILSVDGQQSVIYGKGSFERMMGPVRDSQSSYWSYFYTDRPMYKPTDTLRFWGYVEDRKTGDRPENVRVWIGQSGWCSWSDLSCKEPEPLIFDESTVKVTERGTFEGVLDLIGVTPGYYDVVVEVNGQRVISRGISVSEYEKPAYTLTITPDVEAAFVGDTVGYTVHGEFFEGTPVKGLQVLTDTSFGQQTLILDEGGNARGSFIPYEEVLEGWRYPRPAYLSVSPARPEEGDITGSTNIMIFGPKVYLDVSWEDTSIQDHVGRVNLTARETQAINSWDPKVFAPKPRGGQVITGQLIEITYTRMEVGSSYDFVRKEVIKQYQYNRNEKTIDDFSVSTGPDGKAVYEFPAPNPDANYFVKLSAKDEFGRTDKTDVYVWQKQSYEYGQDMSLRFVNMDEKANPDAFKGYGVDEKVHLSIEQNEVPFIPGQNGSFLYFQAQQGVQETDVRTSSQYEFTFKREDIPNVAVYGVYFDGEAYAEIGNNFVWGGPTSLNIFYDVSLNELQMKVTSDKETYRPGEDVTLNVEVKNKEAQPIVGEVNLNMVDESFYTLAGENVNPLSELFRSVDSGVLSTQVSRETATMQSMAEGGGGGDRGRFIFKDTASFTTLVTDKEGKGTYRFTLPDNITSWRVTAQAFQTDQKLAGNTKININASLPFFAIPVMRDSYLDADEPVLLLRAGGTQVSSDTPVTYQVKISDAGVDQIFNTNAGSSARFPLPDLNIGPHEVTIVATAGNLKDTITRTVHIVPSRLVKPVIATAQLNGNTSVTGASDRLTYVTFLDGNRGQYYGNLLGLSETFGDRADEATVRVVATEMLHAEFGETQSVPDIMASSYQGQGIRLLPYGSEDYDLTAKIALFRQTPFDENQMKLFFENALYTEDQKGTSTSIDARQAAEAYAAIAAMGEPVLAEVQRFAAEKDLDTDTQLYLALALHFLGSDEEARMMYRELAKGLKKDVGYAYLPSEHVETVAEQTALLAVLAGALGEPERNQLFDYVMNQQAGNTLIALEQALYIKETLPTLQSGPVIVGYMIEGERKHVTLDKGQSVTIPVTPEELRDLRPSAEQGMVLAVSRYETPLVDPKAPVDNRLGLVRTYASVDGQQSTSFKEGDLIRVDIHYTVPPSGRKIDPSQPVEQTADVSGTEIPGSLTENYEITDVLPSGLTPVTSSMSTGYYHETKGCVDYPNQVIDQRVSFVVNNDYYVDAACGDNTLTYYARVVTPGTYEAESVYIRSSRDPEISNHSPETTVKITE